MRIAAGTVVTAAAVHRPGWVETAGGRVTAVGGGAPPRPPDLDLPWHTVVPGFVDQHCHGGGGSSYTGSAEDAARALAFHRAHGTTTTLASLVTATRAQLLRSLAALTDLVASEDLAGVHLEGPWLATSRAGAHDPALLRDPDRAQVALLLATGAGIVRMITLAPERRGAMDAIRQLTDAGAVAAIGHTDADYETTRAAIAAGARVATHTFNAMAPLHHRHPGPVLALLEDPHVTCEVVADGVHLHPAVLRHLLGSAGPGRVAAVTDAMAAAGMPDGAYSLGGQAVTVAGGGAHLRGTTTIAGSTTTMDALFRATLAAIDPFAGTAPVDVPHRGPVPAGDQSPVGERQELSRADAARSAGPAVASDEALKAAVAVTSSTPARVLGLADVGDLAPLRRADLVVMDTHHHVAAVLRRGTWLGEAPRPEPSTSLP